MSCCPRGAIQQCSTILLETPLSVPRQRQRQPGSLVVKLCRTSRPADSLGGLHLTYGGTTKCGICPKHRALSRRYLLYRERLRLLPGVTRQTGRVTVNTQLLGPPRAQLVLRQHAE